MGDILLNAAPQNRNDKPKIKATIMLPIKGIPFKYLEYRTINGIAITIPMTLAASESSRQANVPIENSRMDIKRAVRFLTKPDGSGRMGRLILSIS